MLKIFFHLSQQYGMFACYGFGAGLEPRFEDPWNKTTDRYSLLNYIDRFQRIAVD